MRVPLSPSSRLVLVLVVIAVVLTIGLGRGAIGPALPSAPGEASATATEAIGGSASTATDAASSARRMASAAPLASAVGACVPTDQDRFVYKPDRLSVATSCVRVSGVVAAFRVEADGDLHLLLDLDRPYRSLLTSANAGEELGDLVVEPVCVRPVTQRDAIATCASDPDPLAGPFPEPGQHVWMEGRYVLDLEHGGWAELHPLYRWGPEEGTP